MSSTAILTGSGAILISGPGGTTGQIYSKSSITSLLENFAGSSGARFALMATIGDRTFEIIAVADNPATPGYGNVIFGATTALTAQEETAVILGSGNGGGGVESTADGIDQSTEILAIGITLGQQLVQAELLNASITGPLNVVDSINSAQAIESIETEITSLSAKIPNLIDDRIPVDVGLDRGSGVIDEGTLRITTATDDPALDKLISIDDRLLLTETRSYRRYAETAYSSASANNAAAVISLPAQGPTGVIVIDEIIACYASVPVQGQLSVTGIQTLGSAPVMNAAHQMPIVAAGPAPLTVRMRGAVNQPVSISLAAGGSGVVAVLWVGWHVEQL